MQLEQQCRAQALPERHAHALLVSNPFDWRPAGRPSTKSPSGRVSLTYLTSRSMTARTVTAIGAI